MQQITSLLSKEHNHFNRLSSQSQKLLASILLYGVIGPLFGIFANAFIFRQTQSFSLTADYNLTLFIGIPLGFYVNGLLLRKFSANFLYFVSLFFMSVIITGLIFLQHLSLWIICAFGGIDGIAVGMYWANRNLLTLKTTTSQNRIYFSGIESLTITFTNIIIPAIIGWFLIFGTTHHLYSTIDAYKTVAVTMLFIVTIIGFLMMSFTIKYGSVQTLILRRPHASWNKFRLLQLILGLMSGMSALIPTLMVLTLLGKEDTLGTVQSLSSILSSVIVYQLAKKLGTQQRYRLLQISFLLGIIGAGFFSIYYSGFGVVIFFAAQALTTPLIWIATQSLNYDLIDKDPDQSKHYAYVCDQEIYLNAGRIIAILLFIGMITLSSNTIALRFTPLIFTATQIFLVILGKSIEKK